MSKRNSEGDVIANRISLLEAKGQKLLASLYGSRPDWDTTDSAAKAPDEDDTQELKQNYAHDRIGLGGIIPTDIEDGSFTKRIPTSDDKLLQQLIGKKRAKAHIIAKQEAARPQAANKAQRYGKPTATKKDESEDEGEGRAATFKSKRQRKEAKKPATVDSDDEDEETRAKRLATSTGTEEVDGHALAGASKNEKEDRAPNDEPVVKDQGPKEKELVAESEVTQPAPKRAKTKPKSFLDEILADRSKKKGKKNKA